MQSPIDSIYNTLIEHVPKKYAPVKKRAFRLGYYLLATVAIALFVLRQVFHFFGHTASSDERLIITLIIQFVGLVMMIEPMVEHAIWFRFLPQNLLRDSSAQAKADYETSAGLDGFSKHELEFVAKRLRSDVDRVRLYTNTTVGPVDKLGVFPLLASGVPTGLLQLYGPAPLHVPDGVFSWIVAGVIGYVLLFLVAVSGLRRLHRFEELAQTAELAVEMKKQSETAADPRPEGEKARTMTA